MKDETPLRAQGMPSPVDLLIVYLVVLAYMAYAGYGFRAIGNKWLSLGFSAGLGMLPFLYSLFRGFRLRDVFSIRRPTIRSSFGGVILIIGVFLIIAGILAVVAPYLPKNGKSDSALQIQILDESFLYSVLALAVFPAIFEELLCRGFLLSSLRVVLSPRLAVVFCGFLFALLHMDLAKMPFTFIAGLALSAVALESGSLFIPVVMHFVFNFLLFIVVRFGKSLPLNPGAVASGDRYALYRAAVIWACIGALLVSVGWSFVKRSVRGRNPEAR